MLVLFVSVLLFEVSTTMFKVIKKSSSLPMKPVLFTTNVRVRDFVYNIQSNVTTV